MVAFHAQDRGDHRTESVTIIPSRKGKEHGRKKKGCALDWSPVPRGGGRRYDYPGLWGGGSRHFVLTRGEEGGYLPNEKTRASSLFQSPSAAKESWSSAHTPPGGGEKSA